jgi:hypothetical protein
MASIQELREKYPQYSDMSDQDFADRFHQKFYSDMPKQDFYNKIGMNESGNLISDAASLTPHTTDQFIDRAKWLGKTAGSMAAGAGQQILNTGLGAVNLGLKGINALNNTTKGPGEREIEGNQGAPQIPMLDVAPHNIASKAGELGSFFAVPPLLKGLRPLPGMEHAANAVMKIPAIAHAVSHAGNVIKSAPFLYKVGGNAFLGASMSPNSPVLGSIVGGSIPAISRLIKNPAQAGRDIIESSPVIKKFISKFKPEEHAENIVENIAPGKPTIHGNAESLANDIRHAHDVRSENASEFLNHALDRAGNEKIYEVADPLISTKMDEIKNFTGQAEDLKIGDLYDAFKRNPSFRNAHNLQSEIGTMMDSLKSNKMTPEQRMDFGKLKSVRDKLKKDIDSFLSKRDLNSNESISPMYKTGIDLYREHVAPFLGDKKLREIVRGRKSTVKNIHSIFDTPANKIDKNGKLNIGHVNKIIQDLPEEAKNKILYSAMGGAPKDANALLKNISKIENKGFSSYFSPELHEDINLLNKKLKNRKNLGTIGKVGGIGAAIGGTYGTGNALIHALGARNES